MTRRRLAGRRRATASATVGFVAASAATSGSSGADTVVSLPAGVTAGHLMVIFHIADRDGDLTSMTAPAGWTLYTSRGGTIGDMKMWWKIATASEPASYTLGEGFDCHAAATLLAFSGFDSASPFHLGATSYSTTSSTSHTAPALDSGVTNGMLVTFHGANDSSNAIRSYTAPSGMTKRSESADNRWTTVASCTLPLTGTGAIAAQTATCSDSSPYIGASVVIKPAP